MDEDQPEFRRRIGRNVRQLRLNRGLTQEELAHRLGTNRKSISRVEHGKVNARIDTLNRISTELSADISALTASTSKLRTVPGVTRQELLALRQSLHDAQRLVDRALASWERPRSKRKRA